MYTEEIKMLLKKHYNRSAHTLTVDSSLKKGNRVYYYTLDNEKEILTIRDAFNSQLSKDEIGKLTELRQMNPTAADGRETNQCACYSETDGSWSVDFFNITGVRYHRTLGKRVAATLILSKYPVVSLSESHRDTFYGFWDSPNFRRPDADRQMTEGISYWANKNLSQNSRFRAFAADFFSMIGSAEKQYILQDVGRTIERMGFFLPSVSYSTLLRFHTPAELIRAFLPEDVVLNIDRNRTDMNVGYVMAKLAPVVSSRDWPVLTGMDPAIVSKSVTLQALFDGLTTRQSVVDFIANYYKHTVGCGACDSVIGGYARGYANMCLQRNVPIRLSYTDDSLVQAHDTLSSL